MPDHVSIHLSLSLSIYLYLSTYISSYLSNYADKNVCRFSGLVPHLLLHLLLLDVAFVCLTYFLDYMRLMTVYNLVLLIS